MRKEMDLSSLFAHFLLAAALCWCSSIAYAQPSKWESSTENPLNLRGEIIKGHPFSANLYLRTYLLNKDGSTTVIKDENFVKLARDAQGKVLISGANLIHGACDDKMVKEDSCGTERVTVFDPNYLTVTHWLEKSNAGKEVSVVKLTPEQSQEMQALTSLLSDKTARPEEDPEISKVVDLGSKTIEGVSARGFKFISYIKDNNVEKPIHSREYWVSASMDLILLSVDYVPYKRKIVSGLEHLSLFPGPESFQWPEDYCLCYREIGPGVNVDLDIQNLEGWFPKARD